MRKLGSVKTVLIKICKIYKSLRKTGKFKDIASNALILVIGYLNSSRCVKVAFSLSSIPPKEQNTNLAVPYYLKFKKAKASKMI